VVYVARIKEIMIGFTVLFGRPDRKVLLRGLAGYERWAVDCAEFLDRLISCLKRRDFLTKCVFYDNVHAVFQNCEEFCYSTWYTARILRPTTTEVE